MTDGPIRAELAWSDTATALGIVARSSSPVLALCRKLLEAGHGPTTPLEAWRGGVLCLRVRSIGAAALLETDGTSFYPSQRAVQPAGKEKPKTPAPDVEIYAIAEAAE
jgi:hypothetical protein